MSGHVNIGGAWKDVNSLSANIGGTWKDVDSAYTKVGGAWKQFYSAIAPDAFDFLVQDSLSTNEASVTFNNLTTTYGGDYRHLQIRGVSKSTRNNNSDNLKIIVNSLGGTSYAWHTMYGTSANISHYSSSSTSAALGPGIPGEPNLYKFGAFVIDILDFAQTDKNTVIRYMGGHPQAGHGIASVLVNSNAAVESLQFSSWTGGTNLRAGTRFSVYGIRG